MSSRCERCDLVDTRLRELYHTCTGDTTTAESGIEDLGSSAGSSIDVGKFLRNFNFFPSSICFPISNCFYE